jgi:tRNA-splicing ligase RtcB
MDRNVRYRQKNVHDIKVGDMVVRLWSVDGPADRHEIEKAFLPLARSYFVHPYVALMPDWHPGEDAVVGSVVPTRNVLLPQVIGGDIGCGMCAVRLPAVLGDLMPFLEAIGTELRQAIPVGTAHNAVVTDRVNDNALWRNELRASLSNRTLRKLIRQFGSLGGGNHFLELQRDSEERVWIMLHSGSRYLGVEIRDYYVAEGQRLEGIDRKLYSRIPHLPADSTVGADYLQDVQSVKDFARESRREMMLRSLEVIQRHLPALDAVNIMRSAVDISHNYVALEEYFGERLYIHRKGAIHLAQGDTGFVPGSMGSASYVVEGRGNEYAFCSCAHGGGRAMSRAAAARSISQKRLSESMDGILCVHDGLLLDEAPDAYKDIRTVMRGQSDLVKVLYELCPVVSIKGR